eukprot:514300-Pelagomonas_calceolata.AAC.1
MISNLARASQDHVFFYKVKSHAEIAGNECADQIAKYQASLALAQEESLPQYNLAGYQKKADPRPPQSHPSSP